MVRVFILVLAISLFTFAEQSVDSNATKHLDKNSTIVVSIKNSKKNIFEENCLSCHNHLSFTLENIFFKYLLKYSSEISVKNAMIDYLKNPNPDTTVMPKSYVRVFGIKKPSKLSDEELKKAVDIYWEKYKVFGKLR